MRCSRIASHRRRRILFHLASFPSTRNSRVLHSNPAADGKFRACNGNVEWQEVAGAAVGGSLER